MALPKQKKKGERKKMNCGQGNPWVEPGQVCAQPGLDSTLSGGEDFNPQPT